MITLILLKKNENNKLSETNKVQPISVPVG